MVGERLRLKRGPRLQPDSDMAHHQKLGFGCSLLKTDIFYSGCPQCAGLKKEKKNGKKGDCKLFITLLFLQEGIGLVTLPKIKVSFIYIFLMAFLGQAEQRDYSWSSLVRLHRVLRIEACQCHPSRHKDPYLP